MTPPPTHPPALLCVDFDGTLVDADGRIHSADLELLASPAAAMVVPTTGRPLHAVRGVLRRHGLFPDGPVPFPLVLENGAAVYDEQEVLRARHPLPADVRAALVTAMLATPAITFLLFDTDDVRMLWPSGTGDRMIERFGLSVRPFELSERDRAITKALALAETADPLADFSLRTAALPLERAYSLPTVLELTAAGIDKGTGLAALLEARPPRTRVLAAGDGENDLPLFALAELSFAPRDAPEAIRARADRIVDLEAGGVLGPMLAALSG